MIIKSKLHIASSSTNIFKEIKGTIFKHGVNYAHQKVCLYSRTNNQLIAITTSDESGNYAFRVSSATPVYIVALDHQQQFNAVIQDSVVPA